MKGVGQMEQYSLVRAGEYFQVDMYGYQESSILKCDDDYNFLLLLFNKYLLNNENLDLLAYCLKEDGIHMLLYQLNDGLIKNLIQDISNDYDEYFFNKYKVQDILSSGSHVVAKIDDSLIMRVTKNIHRLVDNWIEYPYSSIRAYFYDDTPDWLNKDHIVDFCGTTENYYSYVLRAVAK